MTTPDKKPRDINEYREGLVCLVPRPGVGGITCHEKTLCDCMVLEIFAAYDSLAKENEELKLALFDRSEKYKIAMDKGVLQLGDEIKSLRESLAVAIEVMEKYALYKGERICGCNDCYMCDIADALQKIRGEL